MAEESTEQNEINYEAEARKMGWRPQEEFKGNPENFVDAQTYYQRGREFIPIIQAENRSLKEQLGVAQGLIHQQATRLKANEEAIEALKSYNSQQNLEKVKEQRKELLKARADARREGDADREAELDEAIENANQAIQTSAVAPPGATNGQTPPPAAQQQNPADAPEFIAWRQANPWFDEDPRKQAVAVQIMRENVGKPEFQALTPRQRYDFVGQETKKYFGIDEQTTTRSRPSKVEGGSNEGNRSGMQGGGGKGYNDLPADAKAACERFSMKMVGEGRGFKTKKDWQAHYAKQYFEQEG